MGKGLFLGLLTIDLQFIVENYPPLNTKVKAKEFEINVGGPATNAAVTYANLGGKAGLITAIGKNHFRPMIYADLRNFEINVVDLIPEVSVLPTFASVVTHKESGERTIFSYHPPKIIYDEKKISSDFKEGDILLVDGFHINYAIAMAKLAKSMKIPVVFDGGSWKENMDELLAYVDIAICSENFHPPGTKDSETVIEYLKNKNIQKVAITRGNRPIFYMEDNNKNEISVPQKKVVDTLGAGDVFHGAFCFYYQESLDFESSLIKASEIALKSCLYLGTRAWTNPKKR